MILVLPHYSGITCASIGEGGPQSLFPPCSSNSQNDVIIPPLFFLFFLFPDTSLTFSQAQKHSGALAVAGIFFPLHLLPVTHT